MASTEDREILLITGGALSTLCSGAVVATGLTFPSMMLSRNHPFSNIIFIISLCDMAGSIAFMFGFPYAGTTLCTAQSFLLFFFLPASWLWTAALVYQLRCMILFKRLSVSMFTLHCYCWSAALIVALLPLSQNQYGEDDDLSGRALCVLQSNNRHQKFFWVFGLFFGLLLGCVVLMVSWMAHVRWRLRFGGLQQDNKEIVIYRATRLYPMAMLLTWLLSIFVSIMLVTNDSYHLQFIQFGEIAQTQCGTLFALIFFFNSKLTRNRWKDLLWPRPNIEASDNSSECRVVFTDDILDPEGVTFSMENTINEGPRFSALLAFARNSHQQSAPPSECGSSVGGMSPSGHSRQNSNSSIGDIGGADPSLAFRVSTTIRDWLVHRNVNPSPSSGGGGGTLGTTPSTSNIHNGCSSRSESSDYGGTSGAVRMSEMTQISVESTGRGRVPSIQSMQTTASSVPSNLGSSSGGFFAAGKSLNSNTGSSINNGVSVKTPLAEALERVKNDKTMKQQQQQQLSTSVP
jgi:hypothetical protein